MVVVLTAVGDDGGFGFVQSTVVVNLHATQKVPKHTNYLSDVDGGDHDCGR